MTVRPADEDVEARELYSAMVRFVQARGLRREELGSGWWYADGIGDERTLGEAVEYLLVEEFGIDVRNAVPGEIEEFWG